MLKLLDCNNFLVTLLVNQYMKLINVFIISCELSILIFTEILVDTIHIMLSLNYYNYYMMEDNCICILDY